MKVVWHSFQPAWCRQWPFLHYDESNICQIYLYMKNHNSAHYSVGLTHAHPNKYNPQYCYMDMHRISTLLSNSNV